MIKNSRKKGIILMISTVALLLGGCQLALEDAADTGSGDRLVGAIITTEYLQSMDWENEIITGSIDYSEEKFYAEPSEDENRFNFEEIEGFPMYAAVMHKGDENKSYSTSVTDESIEASSHFYFGDFEKIEMEGTIRFTSSPGKIVWWMNPVYQEDNGKVYAVAGQGFSMGGGVAAKGSKTLEEESVFTANRQTKTYSAFIKLNFVMMPSPEKISVVEMDEHNNVLIRREFEPGKLPEELSTNEGTEYLIIETEKAGNGGETFVEREIIDRVNEIFTTFYERDDGILIKMSTSINWR